MRNHLQYETSPYLLQHAENPVDWYPWNEEALTLAKEKDKLILVSIGYSACHWCHVMEKECFDDTAVASYMNNHFINIKVDREERPDIDMVYMNAVQLMSGRGGWPLNVICLPDGRPIYGCTYLPKDKWVNMLYQLVDLFEKDRQKLTNYATDVVAGMQKMSLIELETESSSVNRASIDKMFAAFTTQFDTEEGGFNRVPKFPMPCNYKFLLRHYYHTGETSALEQVKLSLNKMAFGGIYDQIGGGFSRYSTDRFWKVPHFEKMLYDNAQLIGLYAEAFKLTKDELYKKIVDETISFVNEELTSKEGTFFSALDADSDGEEGKFYIWSEKEIDDLLSNESNSFKKYYNVGTLGKWESSNILLRSKSDDEIARHFKISKEDLQKSISNSSKILLSERNKRIKPSLDDKQIISWNGIMVDALLTAYESIGKAEYLAMAEKSLNEIKKMTWSEKGGLKHTMKNGTAKVDGFLEDYAWMALASLHYFSISSDESWLNWSISLTNYAEENFYDESSGMFYFTSKNGEKLIHRKMELEDNVIPSSNSVMCEVLFKLGSLLMENSYLEKSERMVHSMNDNASKHPQAYANWACNMMNFVFPYYEVAITGSNAQNKFTNLNQQYLPNQISVFSTKSSSLIFLKDKDFDRPLIYVCSNGACKKPVSSVEDAIHQIKE
ncbi:MAG TPA: thioredoxin domain-containing protein [Bacteroidia bacterium]|nr:thioredoxin domain-containing protein [Bacteroidia bacterium]HNT79364.1 thioredoxin domain-containing protein [Bacteroidia bacterium]